MLFVVFGLAVIGNFENDEPVDVWPPDFNDDRDVDVGDVILGFSNKVLNPQAYDRRSDFDMDGDIDTGDIIKALSDPVTSKSRMRTKCRT